MSVKPILTEPNKLLRQISKPVENVGDEERRLMDDMLDTMYAAPGIGLAAIQIGVPKRIIVMDISRDEDKKEPRYFVNPVIKNKNNETSKYEEGCLSVPDQFAEIERRRPTVVMGICLSFASSISHRPTSPVPPAKSSLMFVLSFVSPLTSMR